MLKILIIICLLLTVFFTAALADNGYVVVVENINGYNQSQLEDYPGQAFGKMTDRVYLYAADSDIAWLSNHSLSYRQIAYNDEPSCLYLCYGASPDFAGVIYDRGDDYIVTDSKIECNFIRKLPLRNLPFSAPSNSFITDIVEYHPTIDSLIGEVNADSLMDFLSRLSGESPIEIDGETDTIHTRYSGTPGNELAARYIYQTLEDYGYQVDYHSFFSGELRHIAIYNENRAWTVGFEGAAYRMDNNGFWHELDVFVESDLWGVENSGPDSVWITGESGVICFSSNGGLNWVFQNSGTNNYLFGISFVNSNEGWIVGDNGRVLHTTNGGNNWNNQSTPTTSRLYDVCFVDSDYGWAAGRDGAIIHTTNGGQSWVVQTSNTNQRLYGIDFVDRNNGWLVGWDGVIRHTTNGGATWQTVSMGDQDEKYHVDFTSPDHGCIAGWNGRIYVTFNGGETWSVAHTGTQTDLYGIEFANDNLGYATGDGLLLVTHDGGLTWVNQNSEIEGAWRNVVATKLGTTYPDQQTVISGHFDNTSETPLVRATGADDNGSGTMAVLESARLFALSNFEKTIKFCLWTGEEEGLLGSFAYASDAYGNGDNIVGVFNYDMIAYDGNNDYSGEIHAGTMTSSIALGDILIDVIEEYDILISEEFITFGSTNRSDHASFWEYNYPAILGIEDFGGDFHPAYHTVEDNMENIVESYFYEYVKAAVGAIAVLAVPDTVSSGVEDNVALPSEYLLIDNYPNPFNAETVLLFNLPYQARAKLVVFDLLGREVETLVDEFLPAGEHQVNWYANEYSSGIYFYKLSAGELNTSGRMVLLK